MNEPESNMVGRGASLAPPPGAAPPVDSDRRARGEWRRFWMKLLLQPVLLLGSGALLIVGLGLAQRHGFLSAATSQSPDRATTGSDSARYVCPMMCTPPQTEPGRCPVCAMELVPAAAGGFGQGERSIHIDPAARRVANIQTAPVISMPMSRTIRAIGELRYDEGSLKTISAYVDGRLDRLYADYTGVVVRKGDRLALLYSPKLYSGQVELLLARRAHLRSSPSESTAAALGDDLYRSAKERLILLGMTESQIQALEAAGKANSRLELQAPISGTVIKKEAVEGQYVNEGDAIYQLADLSSVWLMLRLFPEDAAAVRYGQRVDAELQSLPGRRFTGRVAFVDPSVDPTTRTVGVRVTMPNENRELRVGDYAAAALEVPLTDSATKSIYDPELANKWISPRHPHVIADAPGKCPICGVALVPASEFGFTDQAPSQQDVLVVPRDAILRAGGHSVVYVETQPGNFEIRSVVTGPSSDGKTVIQSGVALGERVATRGNFLIDSQMQLVGNPSLIDPSLIDPSRLPPPESPTDEQLAAFAQLPATDRALAEKQGICPVSEEPLGSMGMPVKVDVQGKPVFICCEGCREALLSEPDQYLAKLKEARPQWPPAPKAGPQDPDRGRVPSGTRQPPGPTEEAPATARAHDDR